LIAIVHCQNSGLMQSPWVTARCDQSAKGTSINRQNKEYFSKNPLLIEVGGGFFFAPGDAIGSAKRLEALP
jgi:hypothetical protein